MRRSAIYILSVAMLALSAGCDIVHTPVSLDTTGIKPKVDYSMLQEVLDETVTDQGQLVVEIVKTKRQSMSRQIKLLAVTGPTVTPWLFRSDNQQLAYWFNARATWAIELATRCEFSEKHAGERIISRPFPLDGRMMTLCDIDDILRDDKDLRSVATAPGVHYNRAAMPTVIFTPDNIRQRIAERFNDFIYDPKRFKIDIAKKKIYIPPVIWDMRQKYIQQYNNRYNSASLDILPALKCLVAGGAHRRLQDAIGYSIGSNKMPWSLTTLLEYSPVNP